MKAPHDKKCALWPEKSSKTFFEALWLSENFLSQWTAVLQELKNIKAEATEEVERIVKHRLETDQRNSNSYGGISSIMASEQKVWGSTSSALALTAPFISFSFYLREIQL